jgi:transposase
MGLLTMSRRERSRLECVWQVKAGRMTLVKAAELMGISYRQAKRVQARYVEQGDAGLVHRLRGRASNRSVDKSRRDAVVELYRSKYGDFGLTLACEYLARDGHAVSVSTLRGWLMGTGLWSPRRRRRKHRRWRQRKEHRGEMVQMDGSHHRWFEDRGGPCVLMVMVDDATNFTDAMFFGSETTEAAMTMFKSWVEREGLPRSLYVDKDSIYRTTRDARVEENLENTGALTQFGRAMKELDVKLICAHSPQAKGRVERMNGTLQDRLVKGLRLKGICDLAAGNRFLRDEFLPAFNAQFAVQAARDVDVHCRVGAGVRLEQVLSHQEQRVVQNDGCVTWRGRWWQVKSEAHRQVRSGSKVMVHLKLDGRVELAYRGQLLAFKELPQRPSAVVRGSVAPLRGQAAASRRSWKPGPEHPWKKDKVGGGSNSRSRLLPCSATACSPTARKPPLRKGSNREGHLTVKGTFLSANP